MQISDSDWPKWGWLDILLNSAGSGITILALGFVGHRTSMHLDMSLPDFFLSVVGGALLGLFVGTIPALLVRIAARAITNRLGYINGQLTLLYAGVGVLLCFPLISVFAVVVFPAVLGSGPINGIPKSAGM